MFNLSQSLTLQYELARGHQNVFSVAVEGESEAVQGCNVRIPLYIAGSGAGVQATSTSRSSQQERRAQTTSGCP